MDKFSCWSFIEFYLMESAIYEIDTLPSEKHFLDSYQYLLRKITEYHKPFTEAFALTLRDYLWYAALGEARHSARNCNEYIPEFDGYLNGGREHVYNSLVKNYPPTKHNRDIVYDLFCDNQWGDSFGGDRWANIVESVGHYDILTPSAFIDHCADLQHNGGIAFDKGSVPFWSSNGAGILMNFLTFKFRAPHLVFDVLQEYTWHKISKNVSRKGAYIFNKTHAICRTHDRRLRPSNIKYDLFSEDRYDDDWVLSEPVEGGGGQSCYNCGDIHNEDEMYWSEGHGESFCHNCITQCAGCGEIIFSEDDTHETHNGYTICGYCFTNDFFQCEECYDIHAVDKSLEVDDHFYCEYCYDNNFTECNECDKVFNNDELEEYESEYYCEDCISDLRCGCCDAWVDEALPIKNLDQYPYNKHLIFTETKLCLDCTKKYLDAGYDIWYSTKGLVMSENIKEVLRYPYKDTLKVHLIREYTYEELVNSTQRRLI